MRLLLVDDVSMGTAAFAWRAASYVFASSFDVVVRCNRTADVYNTLSRYSGRLRHVQLWGHGAPGKPLIDGQPLDERNVAWAACKGATVWFRMCHVACGDEGKRFMRGLGQWGASPVAHLALIGPLLSQSYLVGLDAYCAPWWPSKLRSETSAPWLPRTVPAVQMTLPLWAFEPGRGIP